MIQSMTLCMTFNVRYHLLQYLGEMSCARLRRGGTEQLEANRCRGQTPRQLLDMLFAVSDILRGRIF